MTSSLQTQKVVILGAGFLGSHIARALARNPVNRIQLSSRRPQKLFDTLTNEHRATPGTSQEAAALVPRVPSASLLPPVAADITDALSLKTAFADASVIISLVGLLSGSRDQFDRIQWRGVQNVISAVNEVNKKSQGSIKRVIHVSAIGANENSTLDYFRTKALAEKELFEAFGKEGDDASPSLTVLRPSLIFGPGDGFFNRFATLARFLPFLPVFGGGTTRFQPVYVGDLANAVEICARNDEGVQKVCGKKAVIQAGGPDVLTYRQMMERVLQHSHRRRPIISLPYSLGMIQGRVFEILPESILTVTRSQVEQLKLDNVVSKSVAWDHGGKEVGLDDLLRRFGKEEEAELRSVDKILPLYLQ